MEHEHGAAKAEAAAKKTAAARIQAARKGRAIRSTGLNPLQAVRAFAQIKHLLTAHRAGMEAAGRCHGHCDGGDAGDGDSRRAAPQDRPQQQSGRACGPASSERAPLHHARASGSLFAPALPNIRWAIGEQVIAMSNAAQAKEGSSGGFRCAGCHPPFVQFVPPLYASAQPSGAHRLVSTLSLAPATLLSALPFSEISGGAASIGAAEQVWKPEEPPVGEEAFWCRSSS